MISKTGKKHVFLIINHLQKKRAPKQDIVTISITRTFWNPVIRKDIWANEGYLIKVKR